VISIPCRQCRTCRPAVARLRQVPRAARPARQGTGTPARRRPVPVHRPCPAVLHDLRHGAATVAVAAGADTKIVQEMLGHSSRAVTSDTYTSVLYIGAARSSPRRRRDDPAGHDRCKRAIIEQPPPPPNTPRIKNMGKSPDEDGCAARDLNPNPRIKSPLPDSLAVLRRPLVQVMRLCGLRRTAPDVGELQLKLQRGARLPETNTALRSFPLGPMAHAWTGYGRASPIRRARRAAASSSRSRPRQNAKPKARHPRLRFVKQLVLMPGVRAGARRLPRRRRCGG
jgi:Phage integrase family